MTKKFCVIVVLIFLTKLSFSQQVFITGKVVDSLTLAPIPFVHIYYANTNKGTISDINGNFKIEKLTDNKYLIFSYLGYKKDTVSIDDIANIKLIKLSPVDYQLEEIIVTPRPNPADSIIELVTLNREKNNPLNYDNFTCTAYRRFVVTTSIDSIKKNTRLADSIKNKYINFFEQHHIFLAENISEIVYKYPNDWHEKVIDSKISGIKDPTISMLFNELTPFSFYSKTVNIGDKNYLNPINPNSNKYYYFSLRDTIYDGIDTIFIIHYQPYKNKNFEGIEGLLYISKYRWAIKSVVASPYDNTPGLLMNITQNYELIDSLWFPKELKTDIWFTGFTIGGSPLFAHGETVLNEIKINNTDFQKSFTLFNTEVTLKTKNNELLNKYRDNKDSLKDINTYQLLDSIAKNSHLNTLVDLTTALMSGYIPISIFYLPLNNLVQYNVFEKWRLGLGIVTNNKLSERFIIESSAGYGLGDKQWKYSLSAMGYPLKNFRWDLRIGYSKDINRLGQITFQEQQMNLTSPENFWIYYLDKAEYAKSLYLSTSYFINKKLRFSLKISDNQLLFHPDYNYGWEENNIFIKTNNYDYKSLELRMQYNAKTRWIKTPTNILPFYDIETNNIYGYYRFTMDKFKKASHLLALKLELQHKMNFSGRIGVDMEIGTILGDPPISLTYSPISKYEFFAVSSPYTFQILEPNNFFASTFATVHMRYSSNKIKINRYSNPYFVPFISFHIGEISKDIQAHYIEKIPVAKYGYWEVGMNISNILQTPFYSIGIGGAYKLGGYRDKDWRNNTTILLVLDYPF